MWKKSLILNIHVSQKEKRKKITEVLSYLIRPSIWVHSFCVRFLFYPIQILFNKQSNPNIISTYSTVSYINACIIYDTLESNKYFSLNCEKHWIQQLWETNLM